MSEVPASVLALSQFSAERRPRDSRPEPLIRELPPSETYPVEALGEILSAASTRLTQTIQAPAALCSQSLLAAAVLAVQPHRDVVIDGRVSPLSEIFLTIAESGERKSGTDREALRSHREFEKALSERYESELKASEVQRALYEKQKSELIRSTESPTSGNELLASLGEEPRTPLLPMLTVEEPSFEGLFKLFEKGRASLGLFSDEGGRLLGGYGMSSEHQLKTSAGLSELWDAKPISRIRAGDGASILRGRRLSVHLMTQPKVAQLLTGNQMLIGQGLLSRCLTTWPESNVGKRLYQSVDLGTDPALRRYHGRMRAILEHDFPLAEGKQNELQPRPLHLSGQAKQLWVAFHDTIEGQLADGRELAPVRGFASKVPEHALRLAGILACVDDLHAAEISPEKLAAGIELAQFYLGEALRIFHVSEMNPDLVLAQKLLDWAKLRGTICRSQVYQRGPNAIRDKRTATKLIDLLVDHGWLIPTGPTEIDGVLRAETWRVWSEPRV